MEEMGTNAVDNRLYTTVLKSLVADLERIRELGVSEAAGKELDNLLTRLKSDLEAQ